MTDHEVSGERFFRHGGIPIYVGAFVHRRHVHVHSHRFVEFVFVCQGFATHFQAGTTSVLTPGDVFGLAPGAPHSYSIPRQTQIYNVLFQREALGSDGPALEALPGLALLAEQPTQRFVPRVHLAGGERQHVESVIQDAAAESQGEYVGRDIRLKVLLLEFLLMYARAYTRQQQGTPASRGAYTGHIHRALGFMEEHLACSISMEDVARFTGISGDHLARLFRQFTGLTPVEYLTSLRLSRAADLLEEGSHLIGEVAAAVGFEDPSYFSRQFRRAFGVSPSEYRRSSSRPTSS